MLEEAEKEAAPAVEKARAVALESMLVTRSVDGAREEGRLSVRVCVRVLCTGDAVRLEGLEEERDEEREETGEATASCFK